MTNPAPGGEPAPDDVVRSRQPEPARTGHFMRTFFLRAGDITEDALRDITLPVHRWNVAEVRSDAVRRGLRPPAGAEVTVDSIRRQDNGLTAVVYSVPVEPTVNAVGVSATKETPVPTMVDTAPDTTVADTPASDAPVPARTVAAELDESA